MDGSHFDLLTSAAPLSAAARIDPARSLQQGVAVTQEVARTATIYQTAFSAGRRRDLADWQQACALARSHGRNAMPLHSGLNDLLRACGMRAAADSAPARAEGVGEQ